MVTIVCAIVLPHRQTVVIYAYYPSLFHWPSPKDPSLGRRTFVGKPHRQQLPSASTIDAIHTFAPQPRRAMSYESTSQRRTLKLCALRWCA